MIANPTEATADAASSDSPAAKSPFVSVILPHYNDLDNLRQCLALLGRQTFPREQFEIVVAENNSRCGIAAVEAVCGDAARVVPAPIQGAAEARNSGIAASRGAILAFIDSDCRPAADWLANGVAALGKADLVGGRIDVDVAEPGHPSGVEAFEVVFAFDYRRYIEKEGFSVTANMFVPRAIFDKVGGFRSGFAEDLDWGQRAGKLGYRWACADDAIVSHPARRDWRELTKKWGRLANESFVGAQEKPGWRPRWIARNFMVLASPVFHTSRILNSRKLAGSSKLKAIGVLFAIRCWRFGEGFRLLLDRK